MESKLFVGNLSFETSEESLRELFSRAGTVAVVTLIKDRVTGRSRGFGFIEMSSQNEAEAAIKMFNGYRFESREMKVDKARPPEDRGFSSREQRYDRGRDSNRKNRPGAEKKSRRY